MECCFSDNIFPCLRSTPGVGATDHENAWTCRGQQEAVQGGSCQKGKGTAQAGNATAAQRWHPCHKVRPLAYTHCLHTRVSADLQSLPDKGNGMTRLLTCCQYPFHTSKPGPCFHHAGNDHYERVQEGTPFNLGSMCTLCHPHCASIAFKRYKEM